MFVRAGLEFFPACQMLGSLDFVLGGQLASFCACEDIPGRIPEGMSKTMPGTCARKKVGIDAK